MIKKFLTLFVLMFVASQIEARSFQNIKVYDDDEIAPVDTVVLPSGKRALQTAGLVTIDQLFGRDPKSTTWFFIGNDQYSADGVGNAGDTVRIQITAAAPPLNAIYPAVDVTTTVTAAHVADPNPERALALQICNDLEADINFQAAEWNCIVASDFSMVFIESNLYNEHGSRVGCILPLKCFDVSTTGTTTVTEVYTEIEPRGLSTELSRSPNDPRKGILAISGTIQVQAQTVSDLLIENLKTSGGADQIAINGGAGTKWFFQADQTDINNYYIQSLSCNCSGNGIQFQKFCSSNSTLNGSGLQFKIVSGGITTAFPAIRSTDDFKHLFTGGDPTQFGLDIQSGSDDLMSTYRFNPAVLLVAGSADEISVEHSENITGVTTLKCRIFGFERAK